MNWKMLILISFVANTIAPGASADTLQGRVESRNSMKRLIRPAMPSRPVGEALEQVPNKLKRKDNLASNVTNTLGATLDKSNFDSFKKSLQGTVDGSDKELVVAWEQWHKNLCASIYHCWLDCGNIPGDASVSVHITRSGDIDFELQNFYVNPSEQISQNQKQMFENAVGRTLQLVDPGVLSFPARSQRSEVNLTTKFTYTDRQDGPQGYTWKRGDVERVTTPR